MSEWKEYKLGELYDVSSGLSKSADEFGFGYTFISFKDVFNNYFVPEFPEGLVNSNSKDWKTCSVNKGDILITRTSESLDEVGMSSVALKDYEKSTFNGFCKRLRPKEKSDVKISPHYVGYLLRTRFFRKSVANYATMTTRASLNGESIKSIPLRFPPYEIQQEIGRTLYSLDKKITLLRQQNQTLEDLAQTLFKRWFVDFEFPNENSEPYKSSGGKMVSSELGEIPKEWVLKPLSKIADYMNGLACQKYPVENDDEKLPVLKIKELGNGISENSDWAASNIPSKYIVKNGDIIFSWSGTLMIKFWNGDKCALNQHLFKVTSKDYPDWFIYQWTNFHLKHFIAVAKSKATTMGHIKRTHLDEALCVIPPNKLLEELSLKMNPILKSYKNNSREIQTLTNLRDTLLPNLMSGELKLN